MTPSGPDPTAAATPAADDRFAVVEAIRRLSLELDLFVDVFARRHALHRTDLDALGHLWEAEVSHQPMTPTRLSASLSLSPAATSASLDRLQRAGHVVRREDPADRRRTFVTLSEEARTLSMEFFQPLGKRLREAMAGFSDEEVATAHRFLVAMAQATARLTDEIQPGPGR